MVCESKKTGFLIRSGMTGKEESRCDVFLNYQNQKVLQRYEKCCAFLLKVRKASYELCVYEKIFKGKGGAAGGGEGVEQ